MQAALQLWPWGDIHAIEDVEKVHKFIVRGITMALDVVAPYKTIRVRRGDNLYLSSEMLNLMEIRDRATGTEYRRLRNKVSSMVKRDRLRTNLDKLRKANNDPKVLWGLANSALGKSQSSLPASLVCLFVLTRPGGTHDRCFQPVTRFLPSLGQNPPRGPIKPSVTQMAYVF
jgi:hypothetical protein